MINIVVNKHYFSFKKNNCRNIKTGAKFTKDYTQQCLQQNPSGKSILTIIAYSITQSAKKYCARRNPKIRKEMIQIAKCTNPNRKLLTECFQTYLDRMNLTFKVEPDKNKFPYLCWYVQNEDAHFFHF